MPEDLAEMTDEEIEKLAGEIVAEFRAKMVDRTSARSHGLEIDRVGPAR